MQSLVFQRTSDWTPNTLIHSQHTVHGVVVVVVVECAESASHVSPLRLSLTLSNERQSPVAHRIHSIHCVDYCTRVYVRALCPTKPLSQGECGKLQRRIKASDIKRLGRSTRLAMDKLESFSHTKKFMYIWTCNTVFV